MRKLKETSTSYVLETCKEACGGHIDKKYEFTEIEELIDGVKSLPISEDVKEMYKKVKLVF